MWIRTGSNIKSMLANMVRISLRVEHVLTWESNRSESRAFALRSSCPQLGHTAVFGAAPP